MIIKMKFLILILAFTATSYSADDEYNKFWKKKSQVEEKCLKNRKVEKCFPSCFMSRMGYMKGSSINTAALLEGNKHKWTERVHLQKADEITKKCIKQVPKGVEKDIKKSNKKYNNEEEKEKFVICLTAARFINCFHDESKAQNLPPPVRSKRSKTQKNKQ